MHVHATPAKAKGTGLGAIANAAAAAVASMGVTATVDQVLGLSNLPNFGVTPEMKQRAPLLTAQIADENLPGLILLDLACGASLSWRSAVDLLGMAKKRLPLEGATHGRHGRGHSPPTNAALGAFRFLRNMLSLLDLGNAETHSSSRFFKKSANLALRTGTQPLDAAPLRSYVTTMARVESALNHLLGVVAESRRRNSLIFADDEAMVTSTQCVRSGQHKPVLTLAMKDLITVCMQCLPAEGITAFMRRCVTPLCS